MKPKKKRRIPLAVKIIGSIVLAIAAVVAIIVIVLNGTSNADYFKFGKDQIPSVKLVLGEERKLVSTSTTAVPGGGQTKVFEYQVPGTSQNEDMFNYLTYLREKDGFLLLTGFDFNDQEGSCVVGRNSVDEGYEIQLQIEYNRNGYTISVLKQKGGITPVEEENSDPISGSQIPSPNDDDTSVTSGIPMPDPNDDGTASTDDGYIPDPNDDGTSGTDSSQTPNPSNNGTSSNGSLTQGIFDIMNSDTYHMKMKVYSNGVEGVVESFLKNGVSAVLMTTEGVDMRVVVKDGKTYTIMDNYQMMIVQDVYSDSGNSAYVGDTANLIYIGEGSGDFRGKTYKYDEYRDNNDGQFFYYVDRGALKGIRSIVGGMTSDIEILAFDQSVPNSVFDIPSDYEVMEY